MGGILIPKKPKAEAPPPLPPPPPPPPPLPEPAQPEIAKTVEAKVTDQRKRRGRGTNILTGAQGLSDESLQLSKPSLLGGY